MRKLFSQHQEAAHKRVIRTRIWAAVTVLKFTAIAIATTTNIEGMATIYGEHCRHSLPQSLQTYSGHSHNNLHSHSLQTLQLCIPNIDSLQPLSAIAVIRCCHSHCSHSLQPLQPFIPSASFCIRSLFLQSLQPFAATIATIHSKCQPLKPFAATITATAAIRCKYYNYSFQTPTIAAICHLILIIMDGSCIAQIFPSKNIADIGAIHCNH